MLSAHGWRGNALILELPGQNRPTLIQVMKGQIRIYAAFSILTAQIFSSGIFDIGSRALFVRLFTVDSKK